MRRLSEPAEGAEPGPLTSPAEIISRACSTMPADGARRGEDDDGAPPPIQPNRRARRRLRDIAHSTWFYGSRFGAGAAILATVVGIPLWIWQSGAYSKARVQATEAYQNLSQQARHRLALGVGEVLVEGSRHTSPEIIRAALGLGRGDSLFAVDPWIVRRRIEALPWVKNAAVERRFPSSLIVRLVERVPVARFRDGKAMMLVDESGTVIPVSPEAEHEAMILLAGAGAPAAAPALLKLLEEEPALARRVSAAMRIGNRRWDLNFDNGATLRLPEGFERAAWSKFIELNRQHGFLARGAAVFDMRLADRLVIRGAEAKETAPPTTPPAEKSPAIKKPRRTG